MAKETDTNNYRHDATDANVRNHQDSSKIIETQLGQFPTLVNERLPPKNQDSKSQPHVMMILLGFEHTNTPLVYMQP